MLIPALEIERHVSRELDLQSEPNLQPKSTLDDANGV